MIIKYLGRRLAPVFVLTVAVVPLAQAEPPDLSNAAPVNEWVGIGFRQESGTKIDGQGLALRDDHERGAFFRCSAQSLSVTILLEPGNWSDYILNSSTNFRYFEGELTLPNKAVSAVDVLFLPGLKTALIQDRRSVGEIFQAAYDGQRMSLTLPGRPEVTVAFPARNGAFNDFARRCPLIG